MIKIEKDISIIPDSLKLPFVECFPDGIPSSPRTTHLRRIEVIDNKKYIDTGVYNSRYKQEDVKIALKRIYKNKCAFCEQRVESSHVEHYRPKKKYYWLAYSWDNLVLACPSCNQNKGTNFEIRGSSVEFEKTEMSIRQIHNKSIFYDGVENPKMVNPEVTDPFGKIRFCKNGMIESDNENFKYTIEKCKIDRDDLNDQRRTLLDRFKEHARSVLYEYSEPNEQKIGISTAVKMFISDSNDPKLPFLAFKRFAISSGWLNEIVKELN